MEPEAHFMVVAEQRLVPARARNVATQLRKAGLTSVWPAACQDVTPGGHAEVGVVSMHGAPLSLPALATPAFAEFSRGRTVRVVIPLHKCGVAPLFVVYGYQGAESDGVQHALTDQSITSVLCEAKVCFQPAYHSCW